MIDIPANDKRRKLLNDEFKKVTGLDPVIELDKDFISKKPKVYMSKYTHYLQDKLINNEIELIKLKEALNKKTS